MRTYIRKLQSKSENTRKQILVGSLVVCMSFVFLIWINSLGYKFNKDTSAQAREDIKPFALFGKTITDTYNNVTASVGNISSQLKKDLPAQTGESKKEEKVETEKQVDLIPVEYSN
jgi:hypothetical protein